MLQNSEFENMSNAQSSVTTRSKSNTQMIFGKKQIYKYQNNNEKNSVL